jgi:hypothetical protein
MEFVLVTFPTLRPVRMDGAQQGQTGQIIGVQRGTHIFDLGRPQDYAPPSVQTIVAGTSQLQPLVIPFQPVALPVAVGAPPGGMAMAEPERMAPPAPGRRRAKKAARRKKGAGRKKAAPARKKSTRKRRKTRTTAKRAGGSRSPKRGGGRKKTR